MKFVEMHVLFRKGGRVLIQLSAHARYVFMQLLITPLGVMNKVSVTLLKMILILIYMWYIKYIKFKHVCILIDCI